MSLFEDLFKMDVPKVGEIVMVMQSFQEIIDQNVEAAKRCGNDIALAKWARVQPLKSYGLYIVREVVNGLFGIPSALKLYGVHNPIAIDGNEMSYDITNFARIQIKAKAVF